jgi:hypothetical protein
VLDGEPFHAFVMHVGFEGASSSEQGEPSSGPVPKIDRTVTMLSGMVDHLSWARGSARHPAPVNFTLFALDVIESSLRRTRDPS